MERDLRMGRGHWRGCYTFTDIVYDGDTERLCQRRDGGLKMGGTYWYFVSPFLAKPEDTWLMMLY